MHEWMTCKRVWAFRWHGKIIIKRVNPLQKTTPASHIIPLHINSQINWATDGQIDFSLSVVNNSRFISGSELFPSKFSDCKIDFYCIKSLPIYPNRPLNSKWKVMAVPTFLQNTFFENWKSYVASKLGGKEEKNLKLILAVDVDQQNKLELVFEIKQK